MKADKQPMADARLAIPPLEEYAWQEAIDSNEGEARKLLMLCAEQSALLAQAGLSVATPEAVGLLTLWTRNYQQMQGAISLLQSDPNVTKCGQVFTLELIWRSAFELYLQLLVIHGRALPQKVDDDVDESQVLDRINAYVAWSIYQDRGYANNLTQGWRLDRIMDPAGARGAEKDPRIGELMNRLWGDEAIETEQELKKKKRNLRQEALDRKNIYMRWLHHPDLEPWFQRIRESRPRDFYGLISEESASVGRAMAELLSTDAGYPAYQRASSIAHGSTIDAFLTNASGFLMPEVVVDEARLQSAAGHVRRFSHFNGSSLAALFKVVSRQASPGE